MKRLGVIVAIVAGLGVVLIATLWPREPSGPPAEMFAWLPRGNKLPKLFRVPSFSESDQRGVTVTDAILRGKPWIIDFIYTQCTSACPMMTSRMVLLQRALAGLDVRFVSFSVDPANDKPEVLAAYAAKWNVQETRWTLLATRRESLKALVDGFHVTAEPSGDPANRIIHSSIFLLGDAEGFARGVYDSNDSAALDQLVADVRRLSPGSWPPAATAESNSLYLSLGCAGCHGDARIAPPLDGLHGREVTLTDGARVTADDAYLRRSILEPGAQVVAGYAALMPSYVHALSDTQVAKLVTEIDGMTGGTATKDTVAQLVTDPVCGMTVRAVPEALHVTHNGREVYFCSTSCRDEFLAHPEQFKGSEPPHPMR